MCDYFHITFNVCESNIGAKSGVYMRKIIIVVLSLIIIFVVGLVALLILGGEDSETDNNLESISNEEAVAVFNPQSNESASFIATLEGVTTDGDGYNATIEHNSKGDTHYKGEFGGEVFELYSLNGRTIICSNDTCIESPGATSPINSQQYEYNEEDFVNFKENAKYTGREKCTSGTCDVWEISDNEANGKLLINAEGRVDRAEWNSPDGSFSIDYVYQEVNIVEPESIQQFNT